MREKGGGCVGVLVEVGRGVKRGGREEGAFAALVPQLVPVPFHC